jgi:hypothetical protein
MKHSLENEVAQNEVAEDFLLAHLTKQRAWARS